MSLDQTASATTALALLLAPATIDDPGFHAITEGQYVVAAGSIVNGTECKALLDQTLDILHLPELPRHFADGLGFGEAPIDGLPKN